MGRNKYRIIVGIILVLAGGYYRQGATTHAAEPEAKTPVLVELFTSEGCSSCPPADQLLAQLEAQSPAPGVDVIALSEHVDYWNRLGWSDPFSDAQFSRRQEEYSRSFKTSGPYTPQMIVDGSAEFVGSNRATAVQALINAGQKAKASIKLARIADQGGRPTFQVRMTHAEGADRRGAFDLYLAVTENGLSSNVARGENKGRKLSHVEVVRRLDRIDYADAASGVTATHVVQLDRQWKPDNLNVVIFAQSRSNHTILAVAKMPLVAGLPTD